MYIVDTDKLEIVLEQMSKRIEALEQVIRCMGEEFANTKAQGEGLKDMLADAGEGIRYSNERIDVIAYDINEALCAIDEIRGEVDNTYCQLHTDKNIGVGNSAEGKNRGSK